ncbi:MAG: transposase [Thermodesulfobacteriota bacterium]
MPNYRRAREGNTYFFTVVTYQRQPILCCEESRALLREIITKVRNSHPFIIEAWVLLPDHMHCIWRLPDGDVAYSLRWALIKSEFTKRARAWLHMPSPTASRKKYREGTVWQRRFWEHMIRDEQDFSAHCDYIHYNPVKHRVVNTPKDWPYSTFRRYVEAGVYSPDWGATPLQIPTDIGGE